MPNTSIKWTSLRQTSLLQDTCHVTLLDMETSIKHKRSGYIKLAITGTVASVMLVVGMVSYRHQTELIINTANRFLAPYDIRMTSINGIVPGFSSLFIAGLTLEIATSDGTLIHVTEQTFEGVSVSFNARDLVHNKLKQVVIERASLRPPPPCLS